MRLKAHGEGMEKQRPLVSIGIPTYNRAAGTLPMTLKSALDQDYPEIEIIVGDNCSTDGTEAFVKSFKEDRIVYLKHEVNIGPTNNYNACLAAAKGAYFLLLHDDDLIDGDFVSTCMDRVEDDTGCGLIITGTRMINKHGKVMKSIENNAAGNTAEDIYRAWLGDKLSFYLCSTLFNTKALTGIGGFHSKNNLFEDGIAIIKISQNWPVMNIREIRASFRKHSGQRTHAAAVGKWCEDFKEAIEMICDVVETDGQALYYQGMKKFSKVGLEFSSRIKNPFQKAVAVIGVSKSFPTKYWPKTSWKVRLIGAIGSAVHRS
jgi:glycosyltransferase involved in cell wall biosynthesis